MCNYSHMRSHDITWIIISPWTRWCSQQLRLQHSERDHRWRGWTQPARWCFVLSFSLSSWVHHTLLLINLSGSVRGKEGGVEKRESTEKRWREWKNCSLILHTAVPYCKQREAGQRPGNEARKTGSTALNTGIWLGAHLRKLKFSQNLLRLWHWCLRTCSWPSQCQNKTSAWWWNLLVKLLVWTRWYVSLVATNKSTNWLTVPRAHKNGRLE